MSSLRNLDVSQQVAMLFVSLFGLLFLATVAVMLWSLRQPGERVQAITRNLTTTWAATAVFWLAWIVGPIGATVLFALTSFFALREYITLVHTRRGDHRSLILAFFVVLPLQYLLVATEHFNLISVFVPVYVFLAIPVVAALAGDPQRFLERNAKIQWGIMVCVYGLSHAPALLLLDFPRYHGRGAFLVFFLVVVTVAAQLAQHGFSRWLRRRPVARQIDRSFSLRAWFLGALVAGIVGALLYWSTPFKAGQALAMAFIAAGAGTLGQFVMQALKKDAGVPIWGNRRSVTGAVGLLDRVAPLCFAAPVFFHSVRWYFNIR